VTSVFKRMSAILQAKTNKVLDKAEDPRETLDLSYEKQLESLQKVRRSVADVATARKRIELQAGQLQKQADKLQAQAKAASARTTRNWPERHWPRRAALGEQLADLQTQHQQVSEQEEKLVETSQRLQAQVEQFRTRKETLKATYTAAEAQTKVGEAVSGIRSRWATPAARCSGPGQDRRHAGAGRGDRRAARLGALTDLNTPVDDIQAQLDKVSATSRSTRTRRPSKPRSRPVRRPPSSLASKTPNWSRGPRRPPLTSSNWR